MAISGAKSKRPRRLTKAVLLWVAPEMKRNALRAAKRAHADSLSGWIRRVIHEAIVASDAAEKGDAA